jgi:hypothetical protein
MLPFSAFWFSLFAGSVVAAPAPAQISAEEIAAPAGPNAIGASLAAAPDGTLWLSWVEAPAPLAPKPAASGEHHHDAAATAVPARNTLRFATYQTAARRWSAARTIVSGHDVTTSSGDFPLLAVDGHGTAIAVWTDGKGGASWTDSHDHGATWSEPRPWAKESPGVEKFALVTLTDGRILAAWLDARTMHPERKTQSLYARIVGDPGPDVLVDDSVCDCCQTTLTAFLDGGALLAYRGREADEVRDIRVARYHGREWERWKPLNHDGWKINACPMNGPQLASDGGRVAAAWFTAAENTPRVLASYSADAGARFLMPLQIDRGSPSGQVDTVLLHDSAMLVTWLETDGSLWLRRVSPEFATDEPITLAAGGNGRVRGFPRTALLRDYTGGKSVAQFLMAFTREAAGSTALHTLVVSVPEGDLLEAEKSCDCAPTAEELQGYPIRGTIVADQPTDGLRVKHGEVPGVLAAGIRDFHVAAGMQAAVQPGRQFLGRVERRDGAWWLFDVRLIAMAQ